MQVRLVALVPVLALLLTGCSGGGPASEPAATIAPLPSLSASPSSTPQALPSAATASTPQGAAAFVRYFYAELGRAFVEFDSSVLRGLSASSCTTCSNFADSIDKEKSTGNRYSGGGFTVRVAEAVAVDDTKTAVSVVYDAADVRQEVGTGAPKTLPGRKGIAVEVELMRTSDAWLVTEIKELQS